MVDGQPGQSPAVRIEQELRVLVPMALAASEQNDESRQDIARRVIRVVMAVIGPDLRDGSGAAPQAPLP